MTKKNLFIVAACLVIVAVFVQLYSNRSRRAGDSPVGKPLATIDQVTEMDQAVIEKGDTVLHLEKMDQQWIIAEKDGFPADTKKLITLIDHITSYRIASLITTDGSRLADFQLEAPDSDNEKGEGTQLQLKKGDRVVFRMIVGKSRDSVARDGRPSHPDGTYLRIGEKKNVYLIKENLSIDTDIEDWIQKTLIAMAPETVNRVQFERSGDRFEFERETADAEMTLVGRAQSEELDQRSLQDLLDALKAFSINTAIPLNAETENKLQLKAQVTAVLFDGSQFSFQVLERKTVNPLAKEEEEKEEITHYAKLLQAPSAENGSSWYDLNTLGEKWLFELDTWQARIWLKTRADFIKSEEK